MGPWYAISAGGRTAPASPGHTRGCVRDGSGGGKVRRRIKVRIRGELNDISEWGEGFGEVLRGVYIIRVLPINSLLSSLICCILVILLFPSLWSAACDMYLEDRLRYF